MPPSHSEVRTRAQQYLVPGIRPEEALVIAYADLDGQPLDPEVFDDAALILCAGRRVLDGDNLGDAIAYARQELAQSRSGK